MSRKYRRYSLIALDPKTNYKTIFGVDIDKLDIKLFKGGKTTLAEIDKYTMQFNDINELEYDLFNRDIINTDVMLYIEYKESHKVGDEIIENRQTDILYAADKGLKPFTDELATYVNEYSDYFGKFYNEVVYNKDINWWKFLNEYGYISDTLYGYLLDGRRYDVNSLLQRELVKQLTNYKTIRNIYIGTKKYNKKEYSYEGDINTTVGTRISSMNDEINDMLDEFFESTHIHL